MNSAPVLVFDSGLGGLTVYREIAQALPQTDILYCADNGGFPYGDWPEEALAERIVDLIRELTRQFHPSAVVVACNTATIVALEKLRKYMDIPVVGTVPGIKVAAAHSVSGMFSVIATPVTIGREYTRTLIANFASDCDVTLVGSARLARLAEDHMQGRGVSHEDVLAEIAPAFVEKNGRRTDCIVLGCTHFPLLLDLLNQAALWPVDFIDPSSAIAKRLVSVLPDIALREPGVMRHEFLSTAVMPVATMRAVMDMGKFERLGIFGGKSV